MSSMPKIMSSVTFTRQQIVLVVIYLVRTLHSLVHLLHLIPV